MLVIIIAAMHQQLLRRELGHLFKRVVRVHRTLPEPMAALGNSYFKHELRKHAEGNTTEDQWQSFTREWKAYCALLSRRENVPVTDRSAFLSSLGVDAAGNLSDRVVDSLGDEQKARLIELEKEALKYGQRLWKKRD